MFKAARREARKHIRAIAMIGVASALVVGGVASAQGGSGGEGQSSGKRPPGPPPMGIGMKGLTYAELHVRTKEGENEVIRIDQGKVKSVDENSITLTENDGNEVTITVDDETDVLGKPGQEMTVDDLETGQQVSVTAPDGKAATTVMVMPKKGELPEGLKGGPMPPPGAPPLDSSAG